jgi:fructokinase
MTSAQVSSPRRPLCRSDATCGSASPRSYGEDLLVRRGRLVTGSCGQLRIGIDLGGSKIEGIILGNEATALACYRVATPRNDYEATIAAIVDLAKRLSQGIPATTKIGVAIPGSISPRTGLVQNANSTWLNSRPFDRDLTTALGAPVLLANDANCFALSEAIDGAAKRARIVLGVILGTGCGAGIVVDGRLHDGPRSIAGEWGHNPLPWAKLDEYPGPSCWCGRKGCLETWVSGPGMTADHSRQTGKMQTAVEIAAEARSGDQAAIATLNRHADRLARGLAHIVNIVDPDILVLGGGLSQLPQLYEELPGLMAPHIFADQPSVAIKAPRWGDASGSRGAARLWDLPELER